jgi:hypothetical protein
VSKPDLSAEPGPLAAYREGLGLASVAVIRSAEGIRICAGHVESSLTAAETVEARWWCRRMADAERVARAATVRLRRGEHAGESITRAATQLNVALHSEDEISAEATVAVARIDREIERLQRSGQFRSVNKSYRKYRIETSARGERVSPYREWMRKYREKLVREFAISLRYI